MRHLPISASLLTFLAFLLPTPAVSVQITQEGVNRADATSTSSDVAQHIGVIAHDSMLGRTTPSAELNQVAAYVAGRFGDLGLLPRGDGDTFLQEYSIRMTRLQDDKVGVQVGGRALSVDGEIRLVFPNDPTEAITGDVVLVRGSAAAGLPKASVADKIVLVVLPSPSGALFPELSVNMPALASQSPTAVIIITDREASLFADSRTTFQLDIPQPTWEVSSPFRFPLFETRREILDEVLSGHGVDLERAFAESGQAMTVTPLPDLQVDIRLPREVESTETAPNVVGVWQGSDPKLRDEYVVLSAHMDHIGVGPPKASGDSIYNGADDDASGVAAILEIAEACVALGVAPRRSIIFLAVSGEEQGLWGSDFFASHSPVPMGDIVADLNLDMIGRNSPDTIVAIGPEHSDLGATLSDVVGRHPEFGLTAIDDPWPAEQLFFRSDHFNFARLGVPILFLTSGTHEDYHQVTDELINLDTDKVSRVARLMFHMAMAVAQITERPEWNEESYRTIVAGGGQ